MTLPNFTGLIPLQYRILAIVLLIGACIGFGFVKGISRESDRNDAQALKAHQAEDLELQKALVSAKQHALAVIEWQTAAKAYYNDWQERLNHENDNNLAQCTVNPAQPGIRDLRLSGAWLGLYNAAWQPGFDAAGDSGRAAYSLVETGSPLGRTVSPREVLDNVRLNAELCSADRKRLDELIDHLTDIQHGDKR